MTGGLTSMPSCIFFLIGHNFSQLEGPSTIEYAANIQGLSVLRWGFLRFSGVPPLMHNKKNYVSDIAEFAPGKPYTDQYKVKVIDLVSRSRSWYN